MKNRWHTGDGIPISFDEILEEINSYVSDGGKIFIGTDSQIKSSSCLFVTAICLHSNSGRDYAKYFFMKEKVELESYKVLSKRIMHEVQKSIDISVILLETHPEAEIEVHVDVGLTKKSATRKYVDIISGWLQGFGLDCKMKPYSWASSSVADWHTK